MEDDIDYFPLRIRKTIKSSSFVYCKTDIADDDTAILEIPQGALVVTTDFINYRPAFFDLKCGDMFDYGYLVATANFSDLYGTGAIPYSLVVGIRLAKEQSFDDYKQFIAGVNACCKENNTPLVAGDTKIGNELCAFGTAIGYSSSLDSLFTRNNAQVGDTICLSGQIGSFNCATDELSKRKDNYSKKERNLLIRSITRPKLDRLLSLELAENNVANGGIDISDGLGTDIYKMAQASNVGAIIDATKIPIPGWVRNIAKRNDISPWFYAFVTGGDFKFIFTASEDKLGEIKEPFHRIGIITREKNLILKVEDDKNIPLPYIGHTDTGFNGFEEEIHKSLNILKQGS